MNGPTPRGSCAVVAALAVVGLLLTGLPLGRAVPAAIPVSDDGQFLTDLSAPVLPPGGSGVLGYAVGDPLPMPITNVTLSFQLYAFAPAPGGATGPVPDGSLSLGAGADAGGVVTVHLGTISPLQSEPGSFSVSAGAGAGAGAYSVRTELTFTYLGTDDRFESRGYFTEAQWSNATGGGEGPSELNLTDLGVDGITPETAIGVRINAFTVPVELLAAAGGIAAVVGAVVYLRRGPGSTLGAAAPPPPQSAPSAVGK